MASARSDAPSAVPGGALSGRPQGVPDTPPVALKILVAGGFGVGKTTLVGAVSEIRPLRTEEVLTEAGRPVDDTTGVEGKTTTTVAMDFGCLTIDPTLKLYLFGTPGQERFGFMWDALVEGALGGLVIVDTRRLDDCHAAVDYFEHRDIPFAVAVNAFDGKIEHDLDEVRWALDLTEQVPLIAFDARQTGSVRDALLIVLNVALSRAEKAAGGN
jgi:signal recognition particle receptor subunit beta